MPKKNNSGDNSEPKTINKSVSKIKKAKLVATNNEDSKNYQVCSGNLQKDYTKKEIKDKVNDVDKTFAAVIDACKDNIFQKLDEQDTNRKMLHEKMQKNLSGLLNQLEKDKALIKANNEELTYFLKQSVKVSHQSSSTIKLRITGLNEILNIFNKQVEGLMRSQAMKPQDRPIWWDIYRAFPPQQEPVFARPLPTNEVRMIFYPEDEIRGKFHKSGQPLGTTRLADENNKTNCQKFLALYKNIEKAKGDNQNKDEMFSECVDMLQEYFSLKNEWKDHSATEEMIKTRANPMKPTTTKESSSGISEKMIQDIFKE